jgi:hypothetical protein
VLDGKGCRQTEVPVSVDAEGRAVIAIGPDYRTVWYEMEVSPIPCLVDVADELPDA